MRPPLPASHPADVLIVEDNRVNQQVALGLLSRLGYHAVVVGDGLEAVQLLSRRRFDLVLMDIQMPVMDGLEATRVIRSADSSVLDHDVPVVALTANAFAEVREQCLAAGFTDFLTKPVDGRQLAFALQKWIGARAASPAVLTASVMQIGAAGAEPVVDRAGLLERSLDDPELAIDVLNAFLSECPQMTAAVEHALHEQQPAAAATAAHALKGAAANAGAAQLRVTAAQIERLAAAGRLQDASAMLGLMSAQIEELFRVGPRVFESGPVRAGGSA
jgi:two-component system sensor histidine kinase/response regulator